jgi:hypothetical protein
VEKGIAWKTATATQRSSGRQFCPVVSHEVRLTDIDCQAQTSGTVLVQRLRALLSHLGHSQGGFMPFILTRALKRPAGDQS